MYNFNPISYFFSETPISEITASNLSEVCARLPESEVINKTIEGVGQRLFEKSKQNCDKYLKEFNGDWSRRGHVYSMGRVAQLESGVIDEAGTKEIEKRELEIKKKTKAEEKGEEYRPIDAKEKAKNEYFEKTARETWTEKLGPLVKNTPRTVQDIQSIVYQRFVAEAFEQVKEEITNKGLPCLEFGGLTPQPKTHAHHAIFLNKDKDDVVLRVSQEYDLRSPPLEIGYETKTYNLGRALSRISVDLKTGTAESVVVLWGHPPEQGS